MKLWPRYFLTQIILILIITKKRIPKSIFDCSNKITYQENLELSLVHFLLNACKIWKLNSLAHLNSRILTQIILNFNFDLQSFSIGNYFSCLWILFKILFISLMSFTEKKTFVPPSQLGSKQPMRPNILSILFEFLYQIRS